MKLVISNLNLNDLQAKLKEVCKSSFRGYHLPEEGTEIDGLKFRSILDLTPNPHFRKGQYIVAVVKGEINVYPTEDPSQTIVIEGNGSPESWGPLYKISMKEINEFIETPIEELLSPNKRRVTDYKELKNSLEIALYKKFRII